ncbi:MAG: cardiolipin synthase ClsB [Rhodoferax sp.]|uniref:cardiolipin synthase ClsB n=1 Tax=Rhodoferax sp. TaxID=50421 RepID=UPI002613FA8E|nr:cardiolipin synthase ClsB [Rhodoferax sp.]MDD5332140.1 cardiolipin synthase ClsB [Rhodoferax sp.]
MHSLRPGHQVQLLQGGQAFFAALVQAIDRSAHEIRMETYIFNVAASGEQVAEALERAGQRGVEVYLALDGVGTPSLPTPWVARFAAAGVKWCIFSPLGRLGVLIPSRWRRLHRKLCVVDGTVAFCGGINVLDDFYDPNHGVLDSPRFDFAVRVTGPLVQAVHEATAQFWWRLQAASTARSSDFSAAWRALQEAVSLALQARSEAQADAQAPVPGILEHSTHAELVLRDNVRNRSRIERAYRKAIGLARQEIIIANAYFLPGRKLRKGLILAAQRGVRVRLLLHGRYEYFMQYYATRPVYGVLLAAGVEIHEYSVGFLHAKVAVIDGHWATVGSSNLDPLSLLLAREANVVVDDASFAQDLRVRLENAMAQGGVPVDPAVYANRPWRQRLLDWIAFGLVRILLFLNGQRY